MTSFSIHTAATTLAADPMFTLLEDIEQEDAARDVIRSLGRHPDPLVVAMVLKAVETLGDAPAPPVAAPQPAPQAPRTVQRVERLRGAPPPPERRVVPLFADALSLSDKELAEILGIQRSTANQKRHGRIPEKLSRLQRDSMMRTLREKERDIRKALDSLEALRDD